MIDADIIVTDQRNSRTPRGLKPADESPGEGAP